MLTQIFQLYATIYEQSYRVYLSHLLLLYNMYMIKNTLFSVINLLSFVSYCGYYLSTLSFEGFCTYETQLWMIKYVFILKLKKMNWLGLKMIHSFRCRVLGFKCSDVPEWIVNIHIKIQLTYRTIWVRYSANMFHFSLKTMFHCTTFPEYFVYWYGIIEMSVNIFIGKNWIWYLFIW